MQPISVSSVFKAVQDPGDGITRSQQVCFVLVVTQRQDP